MPSPRCLPQRVLCLASTSSIQTSKDHADLKEHIKVGKRRIARLMRELGICGVSRRKSTQTTRKAQKADKAPDLVKRDFTVATVNKLWVADITYVPT